MPSDKKVTREVKLTLLHLNHGLLVTIALSYSAVRSLLLGLDPPRVWALIGIMPGCLQLYQMWGGSSFGLETCG
jgi:hypothetical protein